MCDICGKSSHVNLNCMSKLDGEAKFVMCIDCMDMVQEIQKSNDEDNSTVKTGVCLLCGKVEHGVNFTLVNGQSVHLCDSCVNDIAEKSEVISKKSIDNYVFVLESLLNAKTEEEYDEILAKPPLNSKSVDGAREYVKFLFNVCELNGLLKSKDEFPYFDVVDEVGSLDDDNYTLRDVVVYHPTLCDFWLTFAPLHLYSSAEDFMLHKNAEIVELCTKVAKVRNREYITELSNGNKTEDKDKAHLVLSLTTVSYLLSEYEKFNVIFDLVDDNDLLLEETLSSRGIARENIDVAVGEISCIGETMSYIAETIVKLIENATVPDLKLVSNTLKPNQTVMEKFDTMYPLLKKLITRDLQELQLSDKFIRNDVDCYKAIKHFRNEYRDDESIVKVNPINGAIEKAKDNGVLDSDRKAFILEQFLKANVTVDVAKKSYLALDDDVLAGITVLTPSEINKKLSEIVIGQEQAKKIISVGIYNHMKRLKTGMTGRKSNILMTGSTGVGKTEIARSVSKVLDLPFVSVDATSMTQAGYVGEDVESCVARLLNVCGGDVKRAEKGIIYIDEIDKLARRGSGDRDVSGAGVQQALLKLVEGYRVELKVGDKMNPKVIPVDTSNILFIAGGAFEAITMKTDKKKALGFNSVVEEDKPKEKLRPEDLVKFGMLPEFVGRFPILAELHDLDIADLKRILVEPKDSLVDEYKKLIEVDGVELNITDSALTYIAEQAKDKGTGARGLKSVIEDYMLDLMYDLPDKDGVSVVTVDADAGGLKSIEA